MARLIGLSCDACGHQTTGVDGKETKSDDVGWARVEIAWYQSIQPNKKVDLCPLCAKDALDGFFEGKDAARDLGLLKAEADKPCHHPEKSKSNPNDPPFCGECYSCVSGKAILMIGRLKKLAPK